jgi:hypothetical protein
MHTKIKRIILASLLVGGISNAYALRLPGIPFDLPDGQTQQTDSDQNKTNDSQPVPANNNNGVKNFFASKSGAVQSLNAALRDLSLSQSIFATALDLKEEASVAQANAESLAKGDLTGKDDIKKTVNSTVEVQRKIDEKMALGQKMDAKAKAKFATGIPYYSSGSVHLFKTGAQAASTAMSLSQLRDVNSLIQAASLVYIATEAPTLISSFSNTTKTISNFSSANGIDTSKLNEAKKALGE